MTEGHRLTLTYNLYAHEQLGGIFRNPSTLDVTAFDLFQHAKEALANPNFLPEGLYLEDFIEFRVVVVRHLLTKDAGGTLGFHCKHAYAHSNKRLKATLPYAVKGVDAKVFSVFFKLGVHVSMCAVMEGQSHPLPYLLSSNC